jgi:6-phosphogluconate dehydrogenase
MMHNADIGLIGLGVMGENLALNFESRGHAVCGFDTVEARRQSFAQRGQGRRAWACDSLPALVENLRRPRRLLIMVPAGAAVDAVIASLGPLLAPGDVLMDGGNTHYLDTERRLQQLRTQGVLYAGVGVSGGEQGALLGPALMPGGHEDAWPLIGPLLQSIAARTDEGEPCCHWMGSGGAGHYVKMVHNGIEYAEMQSLCEAYWLMHQLLGMPAPEIADVFERWNQGELASYLVDITARILRQRDPHSGRPLVDLIMDTAEQKGTGKWTSQAALDLGVATPALAQAVFARTLSSLRAQRSLAAQILPGPVAAAAPERKGTIELLGHALMAARICTYAQGFALLQSADAEYSWGLKPAEIAFTWRAGCIIRARLLGDIGRAYQRQSDLPNLMLDSDMAARLRLSQQALREGVALGALHGIAMPALSGSLGYYDAYRSARLPANLLQAQRDYFGAHGYRRIDQPGSFHTLWDH